MKMKWELFPLPTVSAYKSYGVRVKVRTSIGTRRGESKENSGGREIMRGGRALNTVAGRNV